MPLFHVIFIFKYNFSEVIVNLLPFAPFWPDTEIRSLGTEHIYCCYAQRVLYIIQLQILEFNFCFCGYRNNSPVKISENIKAIQKNEILSTEDLMNIYFFITVFKTPTNRNEMPQAGWGNFFLKSLPVKDFTYYESILIYCSKTGWFTSWSDPRLFYFFAVPDESKVHSLAGHKSGKKFLVTDFIFSFLEISGCVWVVVGTCFHPLVTERLAH